MGLFLFFKILKYHNIRIKPSRHFRNTITAFRRHLNLSKGQNTPVFECFLLKKTAFHHGISATTA